MKIGFVFTNFNNSKFTKEAVHSIALSSNIDTSIVIIVDNNSDEENKKELKEIEKEFKFVHLILNDDNLGYFNGLNEGIKYLRSYDLTFEYIVIGNNDLIFPTSFLDSIKSKYEIFDKYPVISPNIITIDGFHQNPHVINKISKVREFIYDLYFSNYYLAKVIKNIAHLTKIISDRNDEEQHEIGQLIYQGYGACYILGPLFFKHFDLLWAPTFLMGEEFFLSKQLEDKGFKIYYEPSIQLNHYCHATMEKMPSSKIWKIARESHKTYRKYVKIWK